MYKVNNSQKNNINLSPKLLAPLLFCFGIKSSECKFCKEKLIENGYDSITFETKKRKFDESNSIHTNLGK